MTGLSEKDRATIEAAIKTAMVDAWADICSDTDCWPVDIQRVGRGPVRLEFRPSIWAELTASWATNAILEASRSSPQAAGEPVAGYCKTCHTGRSVAPCHKCGGLLTAVCDGWEEPDIPDVAPIRALAREVGYALGEHGSKERDLDLIAAPWTADAVSPQALAEHIAKGINGRVLAPESKPAGRWSCNIQIDGWFKIIDLSVCPPPANDRTKALEEERDAWKATAEHHFAHMRAALDLSYHLRYPPCPLLLDQVADLIDCGDGCENAWREHDTNATGCTRSESAEGCPFEMACELRDFAKALRIQAWTLAFAPPPSDQAVNGDDQASPPPPVTP